MSFAERFRSELNLIDAHLRGQLGTAPLPELNKLWESLDYSLFSNGKRFRPLLALLTARALGHELNSVLPLASAVELIHTYSLVHDDLPCMDNDDLRRGLPTNHKVYGEAGALLAGDALLTFAFEVLAKADSAKAVALLATAAGAAGMVGGQVLDIVSAKPNLDLLQRIHRRKTGALIRVSVEAAAVLCQASPNQVAALREFGEHLGLAFQLADDIEDFDPAKPEKISYVSLLGLDQTRNRLRETSTAALNCLKEFGTEADDLRFMITFNHDRV